MDNRYFGEYEQLVAEAGKFHGDICHGISIGTRMTMSGLKRIGIADPKGADRKKLMVFVEIDRCTTDAIMALTGCRPGKRTMKIRDYGKMAATFINIETGKAARVAIRPGRKPAEADAEKKPDYANAAEEELFSITEVEVPLRPEDMPGKPLRRVPCSRCGENIMDGREIEHQGATLCIPCFQKQDYYKSVTKNS
ncbi:MAG: TraR/DksA C4-type zinc finger protein [Proteobacteria bacterium]|nr:TraR/DksA C4-type zinc finger protein [Pseudomonadota bacterium]MBU4295957.1 TraR/DksA C4-type zinc finger protein [Pseudomonadota bacterium]MCG2746167.1 FmdE family protein [Desulfobulbaceae bacterium]